MPEHDPRRPLHPVLEQDDRRARGGDRERELGIALKVVILEEYHKNLSRLRLRLLVTMMVIKRQDHMLSDRQNTLIGELHGLAEVRTPLPHSRHSLTFVL
ncbi:hypothetical protein BD309DRAFT_876715 [Dichomitus squalens]|uniref:Uncharacterized protein n=1 Tax=Dichomitus squalens TaxID=114155 RepID=A0A4Q9PZK1_9APHY|nr:hypothetical protein BD309DRAFT_876715 [Dichomitus squalens]TBU60040.1 hypothetical protein BD310DRAFT_816132 [Dichomitus squalens]